MKLSDIIALAKQGYKPGDIKELISLADTEEIGEENNEPVEEKIEPIAEEKKEPAIEEKSNSPTLDELQAEIAKLRADLKVAQQNNVNKNIDELEVDVDKEISNMFREYM